MKLIIAGSRDIKYGSYRLIEGAIDFFDLIDATEILSGGCSGVDKCAETFAKTQHTDDYPIIDNTLSFTEFTADWDTHGKAAGPIRNKQMAEYGDCLLLIWDGKSKGSSNMKREMEKLGKPVYEIILKEEY